MRYLLLFLASLTVGCATSGTIPREESTVITGYDFTKYAAEGFMITPEQYLGDYESVGMITVTMWPEVKKIIEREAVPSPNGGTRVVERETFQQQPLNIEKAIDQIYEQAASMGADAITRFDTRATTRANGQMMVTGVEITGFAIKRLENLSANEH